MAAPPVPVPLTLAGTVTVVSPATVHALVREPVRRVVPHRLHLRAGQPFALLLASAFPHLHRGLEAEPVRELMSGLPLSRRALGGARGLRSEWAGKDVVETEGGILFGEVVRTRRVVAVLRGRVLATD